MAVKSKRRRANEAVKPRGPQPPEVAVKTLKAFKQPKFDQSVEISMKLDIDPRQADQQIRGSVSLPKGVGKTARVIAFCAEDKVEAAKQAGAVQAGGEDLVAKIEGGWMDFDVAVASPDMMRVVSRLGRVLGPKGLMPSPKAGTVTPNVVQAVKEYTAGKIEYRNDAGGNLHAVIGKMSFPEEDLLENLNYFIDLVQRIRPASAKGGYIKKAVISGTMTPGVQLAV